MKTLGRYPAVIMGIVSAGLQMLLAFGVPLTETQTSGINAVVATVFGVITAYFVARDELLPAILGVLQSILTLGLAFGLDWDANQVAMVMAFAAAVVAVFAVHPNVTAVVAVDGSPVPKQRLTR